MSLSTITEACTLHPARFTQPPPAYEAQLSNAKVDMWRIRHQLIIPLLWYTRPVHQCS